MNISRSMGLKVATAILVAILVSTGTVPSIVEEVEQAHAQTTQTQTSWTVFDNPDFGPENVSRAGWRAGDAVGRGNGYGPGRYWNNYSNYAYASTADGWNPSDSWVEWTLSTGPLAGTYEIQAYIPGNHAVATVEYNIQWCGVDLVDLTVCGHSLSMPITQFFHHGWVSLGQYDVQHYTRYLKTVTEVRVRIEYSRNTTPYGGNDSVAFDAMRMRCVSGCGGTAARPQVPGPVRNLDADIETTNPDASYVDLKYRGQIAWSAPTETESSQATYYSVKIERPELSHNDSTEPWQWTGTTRNTWLSFTGENKCASYTITVRAHNELGAGNESQTWVSVPDCPPVRPSARVELEDRRLWGLDDADVVVSWDAIDGARRYELDWRYVDSDRRIVPARRISGDSKPNSDNKSEILFDPGDRTYTDLRIPRTESWDSTFRHRINNNRTDYIMQIRMRSWGNLGSEYRGDPEWITDWSRWVYHPRSVLTASCGAYRVYNQIEDVLDAIKVADAIITGAGVIATLLTGGVGGLTTVATTVAFRRAVKKAAEELVKKLVRDFAIKRYLIRTIKNIAKGIQEDAADMALMIACMSFAVDQEDWNLDKTNLLKDEIIDSVFSNTTEELSSIASAPIKNQISAALDSILAE